MTAEQDALRRRIPQHRKLIDLREQVSNTTELRKLAAARDKKRDIAALTLNMAISAARQVSGDPTCPVCAAYSFPIAAYWAVPATWGTKCLECGADILIGDNTADCPVCRASWPVVTI